jgi:uncharacterized protein YjbJ (UPF0337 family)
MNNNIKRTPAEVAADASVEHTGQGVLNQMKGNVKETWGKVTGDTSTKLSGTVDKLKGKAQETLGRLEGKEAELESGKSRDRNNDIGKI